MVEEDVDKIIFQFLKGEASPDEAEKLDTWMKASKENKDYFLQLEEVYALTHKHPKFKEKNSEEEWNKLKGRITKGKKSYKKLYFNLSIAASISIVVASFLYLQLQKPAQPATKPNVADTNKDADPLIKEGVYLASNKLENITLEDNSKVKLQSKSEIRLEEGFGKTNRSLRLEGSAEFDVVHQEELPFTVFVQDLEVKDIGTVFSIEEKGDTISIVVKEGIVELTLGENDIRLFEGDSAFYVAKETMLKQFKTQDEVKKHSFKFDGTSLKEVVEMLSSLYNKNIIIKTPETENCELSVSFKEESLANILEVIKVLLDLEITYKNNTYEIYGNECTK